MEGNFEKTSNNQELVIDQILAGKAIITFDHEYPKESEVDGKMIAGNAYGL